MFLRDFWVEWLPQFQDNQIFYVFLELLTIMILLKAIIEIPRLLLLGGRKIW